MDTNSEPTKESIRLLRSPVNSGKPLIMIIDMWW